MPIVKFPDPRKTGPEGIVAVGGDLHPDSLLLAYRNGIFPWPIEGIEDLTWFCPEERGILDFKDLHIPRSLVREAKKAPYHFTFDQAFAKVIKQCAEASRPEQAGTWITDELLRAYKTFHKKGYAHSIEAWDKEKNLVGGVYGVAVDGVFAGESMFHLKPNASKLALLHIIEHLKSRGLGWMDIQVLTPHMQALGAKLIHRDEFLHLLRATQAQDLNLF